MVLPSGACASAFMRATNGATPMPPPTQIWRARAPSNVQLPIRPFHLHPLPTRERCSRVRWSHPGLDESRCARPRPWRRDGEGRALFGMEGDKGELACLVPGPAALDVDRQLQRVHGLVP